jgi:hypothetical protein
MLSSFGSFGQAVSEEKIFKIRPIRKKNCQWWPCLLMDRAKMSNISKKSSPLKPPGQMNQNLVGNIIGRFSIKIAHLVPIR